MHVRIRNYSKISVDIPRRRSHRGEHERGPLTDTLKLPLNTPVTMAVRAAEIRNPTYFKEGVGYRARFYSQQRQQAFWTHIAQGERGWRSVPGALPLCDGGVVVIDDIHRLEPSMHNALEGILMTATEDGFVTATKSHIGRFETHCGVLLTGNPASTLPGFVPRRRNRSGDLSDDRAADLHMALDLLSRIDVVCSLDGARNATAASREMSTLRRASRRTFGQQNPAIRELKVLMARLQDLYEEVDFSGVEPVMEQTTEEMGLVLREITARAGTKQEGKSLKRRMTNSLRKLTAATARLALRGAATEFDVLEARSLLSMKLEVLRYVAGDADTIRPLLPW